MKPKNLKLFYAALVTSIIGVWLFAIGIYGVAVEPLDPEYCCGANIGAGLIIFVGWFFGAVSLALLFLSFVIAPKGK